MKQLIEFELITESKRLKKNVIKFQNQMNIGAWMNFKSCTRFSVATLVLGSRPRQGVAKVQAKSETQESPFMLPGV